MYIEMYIYTVCIAVAQTAEMQQTWKRHPTDRVAVQTMCNNYEDIDLNKSLFTQVI